MGASIVANRFPRVRATLCTDISVAKSSRAIVDSNVLVLAGHFTSQVHAGEILDAWLSTEFEAGAMLRRLSEHQRHLARNGLICSVV